MRLSYYFGIGAASYDNNINNLRICNVENELCCNNLTQYNDIWSLKLSLSDGNVSDYLLSNDKNEVNNLVNNSNYSEICAVLPYATTSVFCLSDSQLHTNEAHQGPFILYTNQDNPNVGSLAVTNISRVAIYRCIVGKVHFITNDSQCNEIENSQIDILLGYAATIPSTAMARRLVRCKNTNGVYYHTIGSDCFQSDSFLLGFAL